MSQNWPRIVEQRLSASNHPMSQNAGLLYDLSSYGVIRFEGCDSQKFLQGQLTCDVAALSAKESTVTAFCNPQGRIRSLMSLLCISEENQYLAVLPQEIIEATLLELKKYAVFYQVTVDDISNQLAVTGMISSVISKVSSQLNLDASALVVTWDSTRCLILLPSPEASALWQQQDLEAAPYAEWLVQDIKKGIARLYANTQQQFLPHNLNLHTSSAVSFNKGCYTGQEVVARMHYKGKLKSHLRYLIGEAQPVPAPGSKLSTDEKNVGEVVSAVVHHKHLHILALCKDSIENTTNIRCNSENTPILELVTIDSDN